MDRRVLVVGSGGREHALCWRLAQDAHGATDRDGAADLGGAADRGLDLLMVAPGNPGMADVAQVVPVAAADMDALLSLVRHESIDLVVIGPEAPLVAGLADRLRAAGVAVVGPDAAAARLEGSKDFCREIAAAAGVPIAVGATFDDVAGALDFARARQGRVVVKADGLAAGKGVAVCGDMVAAERAIRACLVEGAFGDAGRPIVVEEVLVGREVSVIALCDERAILALPAARDHKRLGDDDRGPNTGGMGAISPVDQPSDTDVVRIVDSVHRPILAELARRGAPFRGVLFAGMMITADGPILLECNVRFGDPETQATLPRLATPLLPLLGGVARGRLADVTARAGITGTLLPVHPDAAVAVVVAAAGYPDAPRTGDPITGVATARAMGALVFCAGVARSAGSAGSAGSDAAARDGAAGLADDPGADLVTAGGRVLAVVGQGPTADDAIGSAYDAVARIDIPGMQVRRDIGRTAMPVGGARP
jgi:phosphoribosylamine--glycine ligase